WRDEPAAAGVLGEARPAVRVLYAGDADGRDRAARAQPESVGRGDPRGGVEQPVPLHRLLQHRRGRAGGGGPEQGGPQMTAYIPKHIPAEGYIPPSRQREKPKADYKWIGKNMKRVE